MTLREEFENEVKNTKGGISVLFETSNQHYIDWLENRVKALSQHEVIISDGCLKCKNNLPGKGYWCATNCIKGSKFEPSV